MCVCEKEREREGERAGVAQPKPVQIRAVGAMGRFKGSERAKSGILNEPSDRRGTVR